MMGLYMCEYMCVFATLSLSLSVCVSRCVCMCVCVCVFGILFLPLHTTHVLIEIDTEASQASLQSRPTNPTWFENR